MNVYCNAICVLGRGIEMVESAGNMANAALKKGKSMVATVASAALKKGTSMATTGKSMATTGKSMATTGKSMVATVASAALKKGKSMVATVASAALEKGTSMATTGTSMAIKARNGLLDLTTKKIVCGTYDGAYRTLDFACNFSFRKGIDLVGSGFEKITGEQAKKAKVATIIGDLVKTLQEQISAKEAKAILFKRIGVVVASVLFITTGVLYYAANNKRAPSKMGLTKQPD